VFVSGDTEANNLALRGITDASQTRKNLSNGSSTKKGHVITTNIEHSSVRGISDELEKRGWDITRLPAYEEGIVRIEDVRAALRSDTVLISVMLANNEIGTLQPISQIGELVREERAQERQL